MEYMMIRSVKSSRNAADVSTPTLGLIPEHHNNSQLHRHHSTSRSLHLESQEAQGLSINYTESFNSNSLDCDAGSIDNLNEDPFIGLTGLNPENKTNHTTTTSTTNASRSHRQPTKINISFKNKEIFDRISMTSNMSSATATSLPNPFMNVANRFKGGSLFGNQSCSSISTAPTTVFPPSANYGRLFDNPQTSFPDLKKSTAKAKRGDKRGGLWESSASVIGVNSKPPEKKKKLNLSSLTSSKPAPSSGPTSALVTSLRKRKANEAAAGCSIQPFNIKKPKLLPTPVEFMAHRNSTPEKPFLTQMPNLLNSGDEDEDSRSSFGMDSSASLLTQKPDPVKDTSSNFSTIVVARPSLPIENVFLQKYDPLRLLTRLKSSGRSNVTTKKLIGSGDYPVEFGRSWQSSKTKASTSKTSQANERRQEPKTGKGSGTASTSRSSHVSNEKRYPKYHKHRRKHRVKYIPSGIGIPHEKFRAMAAVYLKRAVKSLRDLTGKGGKKLRSQESSKHGFNKNEQHSRKKLSRDRNKVSNCKPEITGKSVHGETATYGKYEIHNSTLPPPLLVRSIKYPLTYNPYLIHSVELLRHRRELQDRTEALEGQGVVYRLGPLPKKPDAPVKQPFLCQNTTLKSREVKHIISQRLLLDLAHFGFTHTKLRPLEVLADLTASFLTKMSVRLKEVSEMEMHGVDHGFPDAMERVLQEFGLGGIRGLEEFYQTKITNFGQRLEEACVSARRQYAYKVRSKIGLGKSSSTATSSSISSSNVSTTCANNISSVSSICDGSISGVTTGSRPVAINSSNPACVSTTTPSSQPLSPGNSVLAEMLSSQDELQTRDSPVTVSSTAGAVQLEELMGAPPPNVEIRPNSFHSRQQLPLHHLLTSLSQPLQSSQQHLQPQGVSSPAHHHQQQQSPQVVLQTAHPLQSHAPTLGAIAVQQQQSGLQLQQKSFQSQYQAQLGQQPPLPLSLQGLHQQQPQQQAATVNYQPSLTQLLQRPIVNQGSPTTTIISTPTSHPLQNQQQQQQVILQQQSQFQGLVIQGGQQQSPQALVTHQNQTVPQQHQTGMSQLNQRNVSISTTNNAVNSSINSRGMLSIPIQLNITKTQGHSPAASNEQVISSSTVCATNKTSSSKGKTVTIIRSSSVSSPGIVVSSDKGRLVNSNQNTATNSPASLDVFGEYSPVSSNNPPTPTLHHQQLQQNSTTGPANNVISINLGGSSIELDNSGVGVAQPQTVTMHAIEASTLSQSPNTSSSKAKLKEAINQRNLLRLNFEQVPSAGDSTVLLSSSSNPSSSSSGGATNSGIGNVQFLGKVSSSQSISWNSNYP